MDRSMMISLRERVMLKTCLQHGARTRSGDVSPEPPPFFELQKGRVVRRVSRRLGCGA
jgi:hypothetical protein